MNQASCNIKYNHEYAGDLVAWGSTNIKSSPEECCKSCQENMKQNMINKSSKDPCNIWVYCNDEKGCGGGSSPKGSCWLKYQGFAETPTVQAKGPSVPWVSGSLPDPIEDDPVSVNFIILYSLSY